MTDLFEKSIQILELPKVLERLAGQEAASPMAFAHSPVSAR